jgi:hypothetical protein
MISAALCGFCQRANAQIVEIPDPNLERAIREELELSSEVPITQLEMLRLYRLPAQDVGIQDLTGIEYAHNLKDLAIRDNPIHDLTPIAGLRRLEHLQLNGIPIEDLIFLKDLTQLRDLHLFACNITDITPLENLTKLVFLNLEANRIADLKPLSNLTALEALWLGHNYIVDISSLANLTQLKDLHLVDNLIENVKPLANLTRLERLWITHNVVADFSPIQGLSIPDFRYDEVCVLPDLPIQERIENRSLPSIAAAFGDGLDDLWNSLPAVSHLSHDDRIAYHDIFWHGVNFRKAPPWSELIESIEPAIAQRNKLLAKNPNMLFLAHLLSRYSKVGSLFPEDWFGWLRDEDGNPVEKNPNGTYFIDLSLPEVQDVIVGQAVSVAKCGLYDGILYDTWRETSISANILKRIREKVPDDFLIIINQNGLKLPLSVPYINGSFMETFYNLDDEDGYTRNDIVEIETNLIWFEANAREPQINVLRGHGIGAEPPDSPRNKQWLRLFTTMSLTLSDGYALYTLGTIGGQQQYQKHIWHPFWDADLGQPIGPTTQRYQDIEGLYIREFTNGWAVYNRSGQVQTVTLPSSATSVSDRGNNAASLTHLLPDLDGEIYLTSRSFADVNSDGVVNVLDLVQVANGFGQSVPDPNGDGVVNILDLVFVSRYFSEDFEKGYE